MPEVGGGAGAACTENVGTVRVGPLGQLTVMLLVPVAADDVMEMPDVMLDAELTVHEFTVIPDPKLQTAPGCRLAPANVTLSVCPCVPLVGDIPVMVGAGGGAVEVIVKMLVKLPT